MNNVEILKFGYFNSFIRILICHILLQYGYYFNENQWFLMFAGTIILPCFVGLSRPVPNIYKEKPIYSCFSFYIVGGLLGSFLILTISLFINLYLCI